MAQPATKAAGATADSACGGGGKPSSAPASSTSGPNSVLDCIDSDEEDYSAFPDRLDPSPSQQSMEVDQIDPENISKHDFVESAMKVLRTAFSLVDECKGTLHTKLSPLSRALLMRDGVKTVSIQRVRTAFQKVHAGEGSSPLESLLKKVVHESQAESNLVGSFCLVADNGSVGSCDSIRHFATAGSIGCLVDSQIVVYLSSVGLTKYMTVSGTVSNLVKQICLFEKLMASKSFICNLESIAQSSLLTRFMSFRVVTRISSLCLFLMSWKTIWYCSTNQLWTMHCSRSRFCEMDCRLLRNARSSSHQPTQG